MKFTKIRGVIRHSEIQNELEKIGLKEAWINFSLGKTMCSINESVDIKKLENQGMYPVDLERFCHLNKVHCEIIEENSKKPVALSKEAARQFAIDNCRLSELLVTPEMLDMVDRIVAGEISTKAAIDQLLKK